jgi:ribosome-associated translation inhibitor RaiA
LLHIVFHAHRADVTEAVQQRAEQAVQKLAARLRGSTDASVRFADDGAVRRVDIVLNVARRAPLVAVGEGPRYEVALSDAVERLAAHVAHLRSDRERRRHVPSDLRTALADRQADGDDGENDAVPDLLLDVVAVPPRPAAGA